jgi:hypothetical protein
MPQDSHDHARMHIEVNQQRGTCMPGVMNSEPTYSRGVAARRELPVESPGINWGAITTGEDQRRHVVRLLPDLACSLPFRSCCVRLIVSAAATMSGIGSQASDASVFVSR